MKPVKYVVPHVIDFDPQLREAFLTVEGHLAALDAKAGEGGGGGGAGEDEVFIGPSDPGGTYELWYDTDATTTPATGIPRYTSISALKADTTSWVALLTLAPDNHTVLCTRRGTTLASPWMATFNTYVTRTTTSDYGYANVTAAELGFTTVIHAVANVSWSVSSNTQQLCSARLSGNTVQVRVWEWINTTALLTPCLSTSVVLALVVTGEF